MTMPDHRWKLIETYRQQSAADAKACREWLRDLYHSQDRLRGMIRRQHAYTKDLATVYNTFHADKIEPNYLIEDEEGEYIGSIQRRTYGTENTLERQTRIACLRLWLLGMYQRDIAARIERATTAKNGADDRLSLFAEWERGER